MNKKFLFYISIFVFIYGYFLCLEGYFIYKQEQVLKKKDLLYGTTNSHFEMCKLLGYKYTVSGGWYRWHPKNMPSDFPLGTWPSTKILGYEEGYGFQEHTTDSYGFFNKDSWWKEDLDILILGDSFGTALQMPKSKTLSALLRQKGYKVLNLSMNGTGAYFQLSTLKTYGPLLKLKNAVVLWLYYEGNDLKDVEDEYKLPLLREALKTNYTHMSNPEYLSSFDQKGHLGFSYRILSTLTLSRTRTIVSYLAGNQDTIKKFQLALDSGMQYKPQIILFRIPWPKHELNKQWNKLNATVKMELPAELSFYCKNYENSHLNLEGYSEIVRMVDEFMQHGEVFTKIER